MQRLAPLALAFVLVSASTALAQEPDSSPAARAALAHTLYDRALAGVGGSAPPSDIYDWSVRWMRAELEGHVASAARHHLDRMTSLATLVHQMVAAGALSVYVDTECEYYVAEARAWLAHPPRVP